MSIWVAYADNGDLVACADSYQQLVRKAERMGWYLDELLIGRVTP